MTENEPYTPTTQQVRDAVLMSGKPFDQIVEIDDPVEGYSIHDQYVEPGAAFARWLTQHDAEVLTAARPSWEAESREALVTGLMAARWPEHAGGGLFDMDEETIGWLADALIANGVVTLATPAETDDRLAKIEALIAPQWRSIAYDRNALIDDIRAILEAPVASQGDAPADEEWEYRLASRANGSGDLHDATMEYGSPEEARDRHGDVEVPAGFSLIVERRQPANVDSKPTRWEQYEADQKPAVPVDALGFPTQEGATFRARDAKAVTEFTVVEPGLFERRDGGFYEPQELDHSSIADVRRAHERSGR